MVKLVHIGINQKLASEIAERQANLMIVWSIETSHYFTQQQNSTSAFNMFFQYVSKNLMVNVGKEFSDVAFQNSYCACVVPRNRASKTAEAIYGSMCTLSMPARIRVKNEFRVKVRIEDSIYCMVYKSVANACFVNIAWLRIVNPERLI